MVVKHEIKSCILAKLEKGVKSTQPALIRAADMAPFPKPGLKLRWGSEGVTEQELRRDKRGGVGEVGSIGET